MIEAKRTDSVRPRYPSAPFCSVALIAMLGIAVSGCGPSRDPNLPPTAHVSGQVTYNGKPVDQGTVTFHPVGTGNPGVGLLDENGNFELSTYAPGDGAVIGQHAVTIDIPPPLDGTSGEDAFSVPDPYTDPKTTPLIVAVPEDGDDGVQLVLED